MRGRIGPAQPPCPSLAHQLNCPIQALSPELSHLRTDTSEKSLR